MIKLTTEDLVQIKSHHLTEEKLKNDLLKFEEGFSNLNILRPATKNDGIISLNQEQLNQYINCFENSSMSRCKFVPASGAASRMFKDLHHLVNNYDITLSLDENLKSINLTHCRDFLNQLRHLAFATHVLEKTKLNQQDLDTDQGKIEFIQYILSEDGLDYSNTPKALIPFHRYSNKSLSAFEEHLLEAKAYAALDNKADVHFTISKDHQEKFDQKLQEVKTAIENETQLTFNVNFSYQSPSTDTVAINLDHSLYRNTNGKLLFRPAGHGALIKNLNQLTADIIFIKNVDNVGFKAHQNTQIIEYKKALAGLCIEVKTKINKWCEALKRQPNENTIKDVHHFLRYYFNDHISSDNIDELLKHLDKPLRVCGMVKNEGDPGGGPFWVKFENEEEKLQIVEKSQIDLSCDKQTKQFEASTHFNPVDIVCHIKDHNGKVFNLSKFVNNDQGFIAKKSVDGQPIKGLELPGLWNGGMAYWHTLFVEIPQDTFTPVKSVFDLIKPSHQNPVEFE